MAFSGALRRAAFRAAPVAGRVFRPAPRCNDYQSSSALFAAVSRRSSGGFSSQLIQSSAPSALRYFFTQGSTEDTDEAYAVPGKFPFKLEDLPLTVTSTYEGKQVTMEINKPSTVTAEELSQVPCVVTVTDEDRGRHMEFTSTVYPDNIIIDSVTVKLLQPDMISKLEQLGGHDVDTEGLDGNTEVLVSKEWSSSQ